jgi:hypothetical protein
MFLDFSQQIVLKVPKARLLAYNAYSPRLSTRPAYACNYPLIQPFLVTIR